MTRRREPVDHRLEHLAGDHQAVNQQERRAQSSIDEGEHQNMNRRAAVSARTSTGTPSTGTIEPASSKSSDNSRVACQDRPTQTSAPMAALESKFGSSE